MHIVTSMKSILHAYINIICNIYIYVSFVKLYVYYNQNRYIIQRFKRIITFIKLLLNIVNGLFSLTNRSIIRFKLYTKILLQF